MSEPQNTNPYVISNDCVFKYTIGTGGTGGTVLDLKDVSFSDSYEMADVTSRRSGGWKWQVPTLRTITLSATLIYDPTSSGFTDVHNAFVNRQRISLTVEDDRGGEILSFVAIIGKFDLNQNLGEAMTASVEFLPAPGDNQ